MASSSALPPGTKVCPLWNQPGKGSCKRGRNCPDWHFQNDGTIRPSKASKKDLKGRRVYPGHTGALRELIERMNIPMPWSCWAHRFKMDGRTSLERAIIEHIYLEPSCQYSSSCIFTLIFTLIIFILILATRRPSSSHAPAARLCQGGGHVVCVCLGVCLGPQLCPHLCQLVALGCPLGSALSPL